MQKIIVTLVLIIGASAMTQGQNKKPVKPAAPVLTPVEQEVNTADRLFNQVLNRQDIAGLELALADDFSRYNEKNEIEDRAQYVSGLKSGWADSTDVKLISRTISNHRIRVFEDTAIVTDLEKIVIRLTGKNFTLSSRHLTVFVKKAGIWKVVTTMYTRAS